ncbi:hypothetical protein Tco_0063625, partial [Tanacetum coccineum]
PPLPKFVPKLVYPEFMPPEDEVLPAEEHPLPVAALPTTDSPGYIPESDSEEDPEEDDDEGPEEDPADYPADGGDNDDDEDEQDTDEIYAEARMSREDWGQSMNASDLVRAEVMSLHTQVVAQQAVITELQAADRRRQAAITEMLAADHRRQAQFIEALKLLKRLQT